MKKILLFVLIMNSGCLLAEESFGFVYSWGFHNTYNSFSNTYTKYLCGKEKTYNTKLILSNSERKSIRARFLSSDFWSLKADFLVSYGDEDNEIIVVSPCAERRFFAQNGTETNFIWFDCSGMPKASQKVGDLILDLSEDIEKIIESKRAYKKSPVSKCGYR